MASADSARETMRQNVKKITGLEVTQFVSLIRKAGMERHGEIVKWLKQKHGLTHGYANFIALEARTPAPTPGDNWLQTLFAGHKQALLPLYTQIIGIVSSFGPDLEVAPKKANVSLRRKKQFALLQPSTGTRLDIGLILKGVPSSSRLEEAGSFNAMCTHRVRVTSRSDVDAQLVRWLRQAYDAAG